MREARPGHCAETRLGKYATHRQSAGFLSCCSNKQTEAGPHAPRVVRECTVQRTDAVCTLNSQLPTEAVTSPTRLGLPVRGAPAGFPKEARPLAPKASLVREGKPKAQKVPLRAGVPVLPPSRLVSLVPLSKPVQQNALSDLSPCPRASGGNALTYHHSPKGFGRVP